GVRAGGRGECDRGCGALFATDRDDDAVEREPVQSVWGAGGWAGGCRGGRGGGAESAEPGGGGWGSHLWGDQRERGECGREDEWIHGAESQSAGGGGEAGIGTCGSEGGGSELRGGAWDGDGVGGPD